MPLAKNVTPPVPTAAFASAELASLIFVGIFASGLAFTIWLGMFMLSQSINTSLVSGPESQRRTSRQLGIGAVLLGLTVALTVVFFQLDRTAIVPDLDGPAPVAASPRGAIVVQPASPATPATPETQTPPAEAPGESLPATPPAV